MSPPSRDFGGVGGEERPEDGGLGGGGVGLVVDGDGLHGDAQDVGEQDEFLAFVVGDVAGGGEEFNPGVPFVLGEADLADEVVQVPGQGLHDLFEARVLGLIEGRDDGVHELLFDGGLFGADAVSGWVVSDMLSPGVVWGRRGFAAWSVGGLAEGPGGSEIQQDRGVFPGQGRLEEAGEVFGGDRARVGAGTAGRITPTASGIPSAVKP